MKIKGGFGYTWRPASLSLLGDNCDFGRWTPSRNAYGARLGRLEILGLPTGLEGTRAQAAPNTVTVDQGTPALALKVQGNGGSPKIRATGPDSTVIQSDPNAQSAKVDGKWFIAENTTDNTTSLVIIGPAAGDWKIDALDGSPAISTVETSAYEGSPQIIAGVGAAKGGKKVLNLGFDLPTGAKLSVEEAGSDSQQTLATDVKPGACDEKVKASPVGGSVSCASITFTPALGAGGERKIYGIVTRDGIEISRSVIATYKATRGRSPRSRRASASPARAPT